MNFNQGTGINLYGTGSATPQWQTPSLYGAASTGFGQPTLYGNATIGSMGFTPDVANTFMPQASDYVFNPNSLAANAVIPGTGGSTGGLQGMWESFRGNGTNLDAVKTLSGIAQGLYGIYSSTQSAKQQKAAMKQQQANWERQYGNTVKQYNTAMEDQYRARRESAGSGAANMETVEEYMARNRGV